ncbi:hypothetical protein POSPLADRAFT_1059274 [Postia placenta MAD-698-R-SB12]|uniref:Uncharacterized protein n=1 Tax=Postia placenta MAD-698-R-SB12 TaxID=670580 RepID=A0A1X6MUH1_9APHY|nr:hypothetical protein POSPLADRAFT_1059274 [Postia placenta MAD-698-R-SB12]OSX59979.1 hypothetical protein POSPLADRAFT_1059274 [Postia placenta MAD-698-R-SB12]
MAQGHIKGLQRQKPSATRHAAKAASQPKKGKRYAAPKKAAAVKHAAMHKVSLSPLANIAKILAIKLVPQELSAKINRSIEQQVASAASSGKLTIMRNAALEGTSLKDSKAKKP